MRSKPLLVVKPKPTKEQVARKAAEEERRANEEYEKSLALFAKETGRTVDELHVMGPVAMLKLFNARLSRPLAHHQETGV
jgi:hypothetical protein